MVNSCGYAGKDSYLTSLFLGKSPEGSLSVFSACSFASNWQLTFLQSAEEGGCLPWKNVPDTRVNLWAAHLQSRHAINQSITPGMYFFV